MKVVLLAGGLGSRISEESHLKPKPMIEIGGFPILWHIMKIYSHYGLTDFIICCGYKGYVIKEYFANYFLHNSDVTFDLAQNKLTYHNPRAEPWKVTLVDTGADSMTGGRIKRIRHHLGQEDFCMTYGDGVSDINVNALIEEHKKGGRWATLTAVQPPGRFGALEMELGRVKSFKEKPPGDGARINGGFFVLSPKVIDLIEDDSTVWEKAPLETLAERDQLNSYFHNGFWQPMDTLRDKHYLEELWKAKDCPWRIWK